jgi:hypothetical protein
LAEGCLAGVPIASISRITWRRTTIGKKITMAATGVVMLVFLIAHVAGNLLIFGNCNTLQCSHADTVKNVLRTAKEQPIDIRRQGAKPGDLALKSNLRYFQRVKSALRRDARINPAGDHDKDDKRYREHGEI